ncbi:unnamed protein product [Colias eurytheme]|nr:unnamed protein product [Colias eurytheme]
MSQLVPYHLLSGEQDDSLMFATMFEYQNDDYAKPVESKVVDFAGAQWYDAIVKLCVGVVHVARGPVWSTAVAAPGAEGRPVVECLRCTDGGAEWGVGVAGGRRARLIRRWRGRRASLTPRYTADRASRVHHARCHRFR